MENPYCRLVSRFVIVDLVLTYREAIFEDRKVSPVLAIVDVPTGSSSTDDSQGQENDKKEQENFDQGGEVLEPGEYLVRKQEDYQAGNKENGDWQRDQG